MSDGALAPVPDQPTKPHELWVELPEFGKGKRALFDMRLDGEDVITLWRLQDVDPTDNAAVLELYGPIMTLIERKCISHNLDRRKIVRRPVPDLLVIWKHWTDAQKDRALNPTHAAG